VIRAGGEAAISRRLSATPPPRTWPSRAYFFTAAAEAMRRILIEHARRKRRQKRGGQWRRVGLSAVDLSGRPGSQDLLAIDEALDDLAREDPAKAELVKLRFHGGLTSAEAAKCLDISKATADRHWAYARAWLLDFLKRSA
jgi:RNA polymerase sigma factor (TIGR02999 family)